MSAVLTHAFEAINALNTLAQKGDSDALDALRRVKLHAEARLEQTQGVVDSRQHDPDEDLL